MSASTPASSRNRRVTSGYSVETRTPAGRSDTSSHGESCGTAITMRTGLAVAFEYFSSPSDSTLLLVSWIQSRPVMPMSKSPSATYTGISCGRRMRTDSMRGSSMVALYATDDDRSTGRSAASNNSRVAFSSDPLGSTSFSTGTILTIRGTNPSETTGRGWPRRGDRARCEDRRRADRRPRSRRG